MNDNQQKAFEKWKIQNGLEAEGISVDLLYKDAFLSGWTAALRQSPSAEVVEALRGALQAAERGELVVIEKTKSSFFPGCGGPSYVSRDGTDQMIGEFRAALAQSSQETEKDRCPLCGVKGWLDTSVNGNLIRCRACKSDWMPKDKACPDPKCGARRPEKDLESKGSSKTTETLTPPVGSLSAGDKPFGDSSTEGRAESRAQPKRTDAAPADNSRASSVVSENQASPVSTSLLPNNSEGENQAATCLGQPNTEPQPSKPKVVCLCGSTRFFQQFMEANFMETMMGRIVLSVGFFPHSEKEAHGQHLGITPEQKKALDDLHKRKIDLADEVLVLNVGGYIGESTRSEIEYAESHGKPVRYLVGLGQPKEDAR